MIIQAIKYGEVNTARLPKQYQEVEWIGVSGTQYIDTGIIPAVGTTIEMELAFTASASTYQLNGSGPDAPHMGISGTGYWHALSTSGVPCVMNQKYALQLVCATKSTFYVNGAVAISNISFTFHSSGTEYNFCIGIWSKAQPTANNCLYEKIYSTKITHNGSLVRDLVPCYRKADGAIGLYDIVNDGFYGNAGTGTFTKGADVGGGGSSGESLEFTYSGNYTDNRVNGVGTVRLNTSGTLTVTSGTATVSAYILGGGGGAVHCVVYGDDNYGGTGGGGGQQVVEVELTEGSYEIVVGTGGIGRNSGGGNYSAGNGGNTVAFGQTSTGGGGAIMEYFASPSGGTGGSPNGKAGGRITSANGTGGSPNGGGVTSSTAQNGGAGYVELTFS